jgi:hypothetical protein
VTGQKGQLTLTKIDVLSEVLCYGSTLGIQSTVPCEVSDLAQELLRQAKTVPLSDFRIPTVFPGFGGNQVKIRPGANFKNLYFLRH